MDVGERVVIEVTMWSSERGNMKLLPQEKFISNDLNVYATFRPIYEIFYNVYVSESINVTI